MKRLNEKKIYNSKAYQDLKKANKGYVSPKQRDELMKKLMQEDKERWEQAKAAHQSYRPWFYHTTDQLDQEKKAALIASVNTSHNRLAIMSYYIVRRVSRKTYGGNV